jgi:hypothetical protein
VQVIGNELLMTCSRFRWSSPRVPHTCNRRRCNSGTDGAAIYSGLTRCVVPFKT